MLDTFEKKPRLSKLRISYIGALVAVVACLGGYAWHVYTLFREAQQTTPQPQIERLSRDLRTYHSQTRQFPTSFPEINQRLWHTNPTPDYGNDGRRARTKNYVYLYRRVNEETCAFWALPVGPRRAYASSFFIVLSASWLRAWKGQAMEDDTIARLPMIPSPDQLADLNMQELPPRVSGSQK
ncbi:MAG: hypothetical protein AB7R40_24455 [Nitrospiraceae bacterium]